MPSGIYTRTKSISKESRKKMSEAKKGAKHPLFGKHRTEKTKRKISDRNIGKKCSLETRIKMSKSHTGVKRPYYKRVKVFKGMRHHSEETKRKMSMAKKGKSSTRKGKHMPKEAIEKIRNFRIGKHNSDAAKRKLRLSTIAHIKRTSGIIPIVGKNEKTILDKLEKENNIQIKRNFHIKNLGYFLDGYCKETNTAYEVDEKYHFDFNGNLREKDIKRQNEIENELNCDFIRIKDCGEF